MRILRLIANACIRPLGVVPATDIRAFDLRVLRRLARMGALLRIPEAERLGEPWLLDCVRILAGGIASTPYKAELRLPYPLIITVSSSNRCALGCTFCYSSSTAAPAEQAVLTSELSHKLAALPTPIIFITGGEPFHHPRLKEVLEPILASGKKVLIATNAPTVRVAKDLLPYRKQITLLLTQWGTQGRHDAVRGNGNFERTWAAADRLACLGHRVSLNYVLSPGTVTQDFEILNEILTGSAHIHRVYLSRELIVGRAPVTASSSGYDHRLQDQVDALHAKFPGRVVPVVPELQAAERAGLPLVARLLGIDLPRSCGAAAWTLHVDARGNCYPCFAHEGMLSIGSLRNEELEAVWKRATLLRQASSSSSSAGSKCWAENSHELLQIGPVRRQGDA